jgi:ABC-2 type transport system permease protein
VFSGYFGLILFSAAAVALGLFISSVTESQVIAFFITFIVLALLYFVGELAEHVPNVLGTVFRTLSFREHYSPFERGLIDVRDVLFFLSSAALALVLAFRALESRKWT